MKLICMFLILGLLAFGISGVLVQDATRTISFSNNVSELFSVFSNKAVTVMFSMVCIAIAIVIPFFFRYIPKDKRYSFLVARKSFEALMLMFVVFIVTLFASEIEIYSMVFLLSIYFIFAAVVHLIALRLPDLATKN